MYNRITVRGRKIWVRCVGAAGDIKTPLAVVNGGPALSAHYLEPLEDLAEDGRQVIFYDALGSARSDDWAEPACTFDDAVRELREVLTALAINRTHLLGHSFGGAVALAYASEQPSCTVSVIAYSPVLNFDHWEREQRRLRDLLPPEVQGEPEPLDVYYRRHLCRVEPWPEPLGRSIEDLLAHPRVFHAMYGPDHFTVTGTLRNLNTLKSLSGVTAPVLLLGGAHDYATPEMLSEVERRLALVERKQFARSSHTAHLEEPAAFRDAVRRFIAKAG